ncbi:phosphatase PAP2 family protein [Patescibacteria group bacterium]|nr:phosphatase PAP2 family protein [Patescibacteria group bacterium]
MTPKGLLFWQPSHDYLRLLTKTATGRRFLVIVNYCIWVFLFLVSFHLIRFQANIFWQLLLATTIAEFVERLVKARLFWKRPLFERKDPIPHGLVKTWYQTGSFPSGHTSKAVFFLLFLLQYPVLNPILYLVVVVPLLCFRVLMGFHYPIDILGGILVGLLSWSVVHNLVFSPYLVESVHLIFNTVFFIK